MFGLGCALWTQPAVGQKARERPKLKDFGDSLERLKWDEKRRATVEKKKARRETEQERGAEDEVVRVETSLVVADVLVLDAQGRAVEGLGREDFLIMEDGRAQEVGAFALGDSANVPRSIVLIIDYSGSQLPYIKMSVEAAKTLVDKLGPRDLMAVVTDDVELLVDFTADKEQLKKGLDVLTQRVADPKGFLANAFGPGRRLGRSAQFSALMATLKEAFDAEDVRPVVIFQTDGDELPYLREPVVEPSVPPNLPRDLHKQEVQRVRWARLDFNRRRREFSLRDMQTAAERASATIYTIVPGYRLVGLSFEEQLRRVDAAHEKSMTAWRVPEEMRWKLDERYYRWPPEAMRHSIEWSLKTQQALIDLSELTGGWADFLEEPAQAAGIYERIFSDVNRRYVVGFLPDQQGARRRPPEGEHRGARPPRVHGLGAQGILRARPRRVSPRCLKTGGARLK